MSFSGVRRLEPSDAEALTALRRESLLDSPLAFAASPEDDVAAHVASVREQLSRAPEHAVYGGFRGALVGCVGIGRDRHLKSAHKAHVWGMYVAPEHRRGGLGGALLEAVLAHARAMPGVARVDLSVSSASPAARRLYERHGFRVWGSEEDAMRYEGEVTTEYHMTLRLDGARPAAGEGGAGWRSR